MFTADNFRQIFDTENRNGVDIAARYFPDLDPKTLAVRNKVAEIRVWRGKKSILSSGDFEAGETRLKSELAELKADKSAAIDLEMEKISTEVAKPAFKIALTQKLGPKAKLVYSIDETPETFFTVKQLQRNIYRIYGVKQANRHDLVCHVRDTVGSEFPFELVRTDISNFYESIDRKRLYAKLDNDQLLSSSSKKLIKQILESYGKLSGSQTGIPRGVGISAYLAEFFLRPVDRAIGEIPGIVLYCRYVDDIVAAFARPPAGGALGSYKDLLAQILLHHGLSQSLTKTQEYNLGDKGVTHKFDYLGYRFTVKAGNLEIAPSKSKVKKLELRLEAAFKSYTNMAPIDSRRAFREVVARVKFLTGNTRLMNSKSSATTGIYYNNPIVTDLHSFEKLDTVLKKKIRAISRPKLRKALKPYSFRQGFTNRRFHNFSSKELQAIVRVWKHVEA